MTSQRIFRFSALALALLLPLGPTAAKETETIHLPASLPLTRDPAPQGGTGAYLAAQAAQRDHDYSQAAYYYRRVLAADGENLDLMRKAFALFAADGSVGEATDIAQQLVARDQGGALSLTLLAVQAASLGAYDQCLARIDTMDTRTALGETLAPLIGAWCTLGQTGLPAAARTLEQARDQATDDTRYLYDYQIGLMAVVVGDTQAALARFQAVLESGHPLSPRMAAVMDSYLLRHDPDFDRATLEQRVNENATYHDLLMVEGAEALADSPLYHVGSIPQGLAETLFTLALSLRNEPGTDLPLYFARLALWLRPEMPLAHFYVAELLEDRQRLAEANEHYLRVQAKSPLGWLVRRRVAMNQHTLEHDAEAAALLMALARARPDRWEAWAELGDLHRYRQEFEAAAAAYDKAAERVDANNQNNWSLYYVMGIALERHGDWPAAEKAFLKSLALRPDQPLVLNYLAYSWVDRGENLDQAAAMLLKAARQRPRDGFINDSVGWANFKLGKYGEAVRWLERAAALEPTDPVINDHLGDVYWITGRRREARFQWERALTLAQDPANEDDMDHTELMETIERKLVHGLTITPKVAESP